VLNAARLANACYGDMSVLLNCKRKLKQCKAGSPVTLMILERSLVGKSYLCRNVNLPAVNCPMEAKEPGVAVHAQSLLGVLASAGE
jgi:hypothetical protein